MKKLAYVVVPFLILFGAPALLVAQTSGPSRGNSGGGGGGGYTSGNLTVTGDAGVDSNFQVTGNSTLGPVVGSQGARVQINKASSGFDTSAFSDLALGITSNSSTPVLIGFFHTTNNAQGGIRVGSGFHFAVPHADGLMLYNNATSTGTPYAYLRPAGLMVNSGASSATAVSATASATPTIDFPSVGAGACGSANFTVTGLASRAIVGVDWGGTGVGATALVPQLIEPNAASSLTLAYCNFTGSPIDAASATPTVTWINF